MRTAVDSYKDENNNSQNQTKKTKHSLHRQSHHSSNNTSLEKKTSLGSNHNKFYPNYYLASMKPIY